MVDQWTDSLLTTPVSRNGRLVYEVDAVTGQQVPKLLELSTRRIRYINPRPFFTWWSKEFEATNPFDRADVPGEDRATPIPVVELDDVRRLLATCDSRSFADLRDAAVIRVLFDTGARLGELVALTVEDFDRRHDFLTLRGKTGTRALPVSPSTGEALSRYLRVRKEHKDAALPAMWLSDKGRLKDSGVAQLLKRRCEQAGIPPLNPQIPSRSRPSTGTPWPTDGRGSKCGPNELSCVAVRMNVARRFYATIRKTIDGPLLVATTSRRLPGDGADRLRLISDHRRRTGKRLGRQEAEIVSCLLDHSRREDHRFESTSLHRSAAMCGSG